MKDSVNFKEAKSIGIQAFLEQKFTYLHYLTGKKLDTQKNALISGLYKRLISEILEMFVKLIKI